MLSLDYCSPKFFLKNQESETVELFLFATYMNYRKHIGATVISWSFDFFALRPNAYSITLENVTVVFFMVTVSNPIFGRNRNRHYSEKWYHI